MKYGGNVINFMEDQLEGMKFMMDGRIVNMSTYQMDRRVKVVCGRLAQ